MKTKLAVIFFFNLILIGSSKASIFSDDEARKFMLENKKQTEAKISSIETKLEEINSSLLKINNDSSQNMKNQLTFSNENQKTHEELAKIRGRIEELFYELEKTNKSQKDLYTDIDTRLSVIEKEKKQKEELAQTEINEYNSNLEKFKEGKHKEASWGFSSFLNKYPNSNKTPEALYWLGNSFYALGDCKKAINTQNKIVNGYTLHEKAPEAMLVIASCEAELGKNEDSKNMLEKIIREYPNTESAKEAKSRLSKYFAANKNKKTTKKK